MAVAARPVATAGGRRIHPTRKLPGADVASRTDTTTATLTAWAVEDAHQIDAQLNVTAESGSAAPTLTVKLQTSMDGTTWRDVPGGAFTAATGVSSVQDTFGAGSLGVLCRWVATISGTTPSFTWNLDTQARVTL